MIPAVHAAFGLGMTAGNFVCAEAADRAQMSAAGETPAFGAVVLALYPAATGSLWTLLPVVS